MIFALSAVSETISLICVSFESLICAVSDDVDRRDSESLLYPSHRSRSARRTAPVKVSSVVDGYEVRVSGRIQQSTYDNAPVSGLIHREI